MIDYYYYFTAEAFSYLSYLTLVKVSLLPHLQIHELSATNHGELSIVKIFQMV